MNIKTSKIFGGGVRYKNIYVLMAVAATCTIISRSEKTDAMFRNILGRAGSIASSVSSGLSRVGRSSTSSTSMGRGISNLRSANTASGNVIHDHTPGGSPVFTTHTGGRRVYYGETDANVLSKELGPDVNPNARYNMYYDADGNAIVRSTTSGRLLRRLAYSEIRIGTHEDHETGEKTKRIVIAGPWWVKGSDIINASSTTSKKPSGIGGDRTGVVSPGVSVPVGPTASGSVDVYTQTEADISGDPVFKPVKKVSV